MQQIQRFVELLDWKVQVFFGSKCHHLLSFVNKITLPTCPISQTAHLPACLLKTALANVTRFVELLDWKVQFFWFQMPVSCHLSILHLQWPTCPISQPAHLPTCLLKTALANITRFVELLDWKVQVFVVPNVIICHLSIKPTCPISQTANRPTCLPAYLKLL